MSDAPHATLFDLPGWPCPPRVCDIPKHVDSWGSVQLSRTAFDPVAVVADEIGHLWVNGTAVPRCKLPENLTHTSNAIAFHHDGGIGLWVPRSSYSYLEHVSRLDMKPDEWLPVNMVATELPSFVKAPGKES